MDVDEDDFDGIPRRSTGMPSKGDDRSMVISPLFDDIPDIDDANEHEDETDEQHFDPMGLFDSSNSIRSSSSSDSLLSLSQFDEELTQSRTDWPIPRTLVQINPLDQVEFIDTLSNHSDISSQLSLGYTEQTQMLINDDGQQTSTSASAQSSPSGTSSPILAMDEDFDQAANASIAPRAALDDDLLLILVEDDEQVMPFSKIIVVRR